MQTKTTGDAKNDKRPSPAPVKAPPVAGKCPNAGTDSGCFCTGKCKTPPSEADRIIAEASGGPGGGEMFRRYNEGDDVHTYRGCREGDGYA